MVNQLSQIKFKSKTKYFSMAMICISVFGCLLVGSFMIPIAFILSSAAFAITVFSDDGVVFLRYFTIAFFVALLFLSKGSVTSAFTGIALFLPGGLSLAFSVKKKKHFVFTIVCMILSTSLVFLMVGLIYIVESGNGFDLTALFEPISAFMKTIISDIYDSLSESPYSNSLLLSAATNKRDFVYDVYTSLFRSIPALLCKILIISSVISFALFKSYTKKHAVQNSGAYYYMGSFSFFRTSRICIFLYVIFSILYYLTSNDLEIMFFSTVTDILSLFFCFEALSLISFYTKAYNLNSILRFFIFAVLFFLCIIPIGIAEIISVIGFADAIWDLRRFCRKIYKS